MTDTEKIGYINSHIGEYALYKSSSDECFMAKIASEVHPINLVVGLDMEDGLVLTFLADIKHISFPWFNA